MVKGPKNLTDNHQNRLNLTVNRQSYTPFEILAYIFYGPLGILLF